ncbi:hypothetical protein C6P44_000412 [Monosporozyma unispora]|nr:hypothetical protein C6P44_000412 [Kazachstania unispora]
MASLPFQYHLMAGACAGISEICMMYPLDVVKTRMQIKTSLKHNSTNIKPDHTMIKTLVNIIKKEGIPNLYKGIVSPIILETPKRAIKFASNDFFQKFYQESLNVSTVNQTISLLAGASAGVVESFLVTPFELVKIRLQNVEQTDKSFTNCFKSIIKQNGPKGMMLGWEPTVWRHLVWNAGYFGIIFQINNLLNTYFPNSSKTTNKLIAGSLGGCLSCFFSLPFDVVKSRIQNGNVDALKKYRWSIQAINLIRKEEGILSLYKSIVPVICRMGPSGAYLYITFSTLTEFFDRFVVVN